MAAGKSIFRIKKVVLKDACIKTAMSRLPFVLLKTHVMTMVKEMADMTYRTMLRRVGGKFQLGTQKMARGKNAKRGRGMRPPTKGPCSRCSRGSPKPRQPGSSPNGPPRKNT